MALVIIRGTDAPSHSPIPGPDEARTADHAPETINAPTASLQPDKVQMRDHIEQIAQSPPTDEVTNGGSEPFWHKAGSTYWSWIWSTLCVIGNVGVMLVPSSLEHSATQVKTAMQSVISIVDLVLKFIPGARLASRSVGLFLAFSIGLLAILYMCFQALKVWEWLFDVHFFMPRKFH